MNACRKYYKCSITLLMGRKGKLNNLNYPFSQLFGRLWLIFNSNPLKILSKLHSSKICWAVMVVIVWYLDLQLPLQLMPMTTKVVSSNSVHGKVCSIQHYVIKSVTCVRSVVFSGYSGFLHKYNCPSRYNWNFVKSGAKYHKPTNQPAFS